MQKLFFALLLSSGILLAQDNNTMSPNTSKASNGQETIRGCVSRANGDYVLIKQDPGMTYELQSTGKIKLRHYLGQRVEVIGTESPSLSTSSDALAKDAAPVTLTITSIKTLDKECPSK
jgi:hypothetical protein